MTGRLVQGTDALVRSTGKEPAACRIVLSTDEIIGERRPGAWWTSVRECSCGRRYRRAGTTRIAAVAKADEWEQRHLQAKLSPSG